MNPQRVTLFGDLFLFVGRIDPVECAMRVKKKMVVDFVERYCTI